MGIVTQPGETFEPALSSAQTFLDTAELEAEPPCVGSARSNCQRMACLIAARKTECAYRIVLAESFRSTIA